MNLADGRRWLKSRARGGGPSRVRLEALEERCLLSELPLALPGAPADAATSARVAAAYVQLPLRFEPNEGQAAGPVDFVSRGSGYTLLLGPSGADLHLQAPAATGTGGGQPAADLRMQLVGASATPRAAAADPLAGSTNYLLGNDPAGWHTGIAGYGRVEYQGVYPGVDLVYYGNQRQLEYDFRLAPGADPGIIRLALQGAEGLSLDGAGDLVLHTAGGDLVEHAPVLYQPTAGGRLPVDGRYVLEGDGRVGFAVGAHDPGKPLVIDPALGYSTYLGGNNVDQGFAVAVDGNGDAYVVGETSSTNFPVTPGAEQGTLADKLANEGDVFVAKLSALGNGLLYATYLGGTSEDGGLGVAVDPSGNAYVCGFTNSLDFPTTANAALRTFTGGNIKGFAAKLDPTGAHLLYSTYLGGDHEDTARAIAADNAGNAYVTGFTSSLNFPVSTTTATSVAAAQPVPRGLENAFVTKLNTLAATGPASLVYSSYFGGNNDQYTGVGVPDEAGNAIAVDGTGNVYLAGDTDSSNFPVTPTAVQTTYVGASPASGTAHVFVAVVNPAVAGQAGLLYSSFLGGSGNDESFGVAQHAGTVYVAGRTGSADFPTTANAFQKTFGGGVGTHTGSGFGDAFVTQINPAVSGQAGLLYSTFLGGKDDDEAHGLAVDQSGNAFVTGTTFSANFPTTANALQGTLCSTRNAWVAELNPAASGAASFLYSTYLGGGSNDIAQAIAVDGKGNAYVTGQTDSDNFPTLNPLQAARGGKAAGLTDAFVLKLLPALASPGSVQLTVATDSVNESAGTYTFTVTRTGGSAGAITVGFAVTGGTAVPGTDFTLPPGAPTLSWADGDTAPKKFTLRLLEDNQSGEPNPTVQLSLTNATGGSIVGCMNSAVLTLIEASTAPPPEGGGGESPPPAGVPPMVTSVQVVRTGRAGKATALLLAFNEGLDQSSATNLSHYVINLGFKGKGKHRKPLFVAVNGAAYDPAKNTVTLALGAVRGPKFGGVLQVKGIIDPQGDVLAGTASFPVNLRPKPRRKRH
jgi:hypothetical protein